MKKKRRVPEPERSPLESARAALERAGEDPSAIPPEKPADDAKPSVTLEKPAVPDSAEAFAPETVENAEASEPETAENAEASAPEVAESAEASAPEAVENAEASEPETAESAEASAPEATENVEASEPETVENAEAPAPEAVENAEASEAETAEAVEAFASVDNAEASAPAESVASSETPEAESVAPPERPEPESVAEPETPEPESVAPSETPAPETTESAEASALPIAAPPQSDALPPAEANASGEEPLFDASEMFPDEDEDEYEDDGEPEAEFAETERHTMETKEFTVGYHRQRTESAEPVRDGKKRGTKSRFKALDRLKDALRSRAEEEQGPDDDPQSGSSRDEAIRKRVMQMEDGETRNYLLDRVLPQMKWYSRKCAKYQTMYYRFMAAAILLGGLIPVFSVGGSYGVVKVILALLGASVTAINAYLALYKYHELWIAYRGTREELIHTLYSYFNRAGVFAQKKMSEAELNVLLVDVCENALSKEMGGWTTTVLHQAD